MDRRILGIFLFVLIVVVGSTLCLNPLNRNDVLESEGSQRYAMKRVVYVSRSRETSITAPPEAFEASFSRIYVAVSEHELRLRQESSDADVESSLRDPTYLEALQFIESDSTDENMYFRENYTCGHFAADFKLNAVEAGYRCGYVVIEFPETCHVIVCFNTTDRGLVFIEPQNDEVVTLTVGEPYWNRAIYEQPQYNDTVVRYTIVW